MTDDPIKMNANDPGHHTPPPLAGTVIVLREAHAPQVLLLRRRPELRFMGGYWVFPGGAADASEARGDRLSGAARAACRELEEEAGVRVPLNSLVHWAHWITPSAAQRRFDTHFFLAVCSPDQTVSIDHSESSEHRWVTLSVDEDLKNVAPLTPPTWAVLREVAETVATVSSLRDLMALASVRPVRTVIPRMNAAGEAVMPWSPDYPGLGGEGVEWPSEAIAARAGWPDRLKAIIRMKNELADP